MDAPGTSPQVTPLHDRHLRAGAKMIPFAGWEMPVQYEGILAEHRAVRTAAGLFDLGHMGQVDISGKDAFDYLQYATTNDVARLGPGAALYSLIPNERGGVIDDIIIYCRVEGDAGYMIVVNAANTERDVAWFRTVRADRRDLDVTINDISHETGMVAIQGPLAERITQPLTDLSLDNLADFTWSSTTIAGQPAMIARTGYTGEDGFEFYAANDRIGTVWDALTESGMKHGLKPVGLGARDTLRLEARMPLYGNELGEEISPYEAGLGWAVSLDKGEFVGRQSMERAKREGVARRSVGFQLLERSGAPRSHFSVEIDGHLAGTVTSGAFSPTLGHNIGLALIKKESAGVGKPLSVVIRGRPVGGVQVKTPFYKRAR